MEQIKETSLKFSESPLCPIAADVISDGESIYFYMYDLDFENERLIARSACWVKNLVEAPLTFQKDKIEEDHQPVLPSMFVDEDMDIKPWNEAELEIVWSKEGHIAGLLSWKLSGVRKDISPVYCITMKSSASYHPGQTVITFPAMRCMRRKTIWLRGS